MAFKTRPIHCLSWQKARLISLGAGLVIVDLEAIPAGVPE